MSIIPETSPSAVHPSWCDARVCAHVGPDHLDHRSAPFELRSSVEEVLISAGLARLDSFEPRAEVTGEVTARLQLADLTSSNPGGSERVLGVDLTAADARLLAAALVCVAEQVEAVAR